MNFHNVTRRHFLQGTAALAASSPFLASAAEASSGLQGRLYKTLKIGMVGVKGSLTDKFKAAKAAGFGAIEMNAPGMNVAATKEAIAGSGLPVDGTVCSSHWQIRHTDADPEKRKV
ncbi:MAG: twin-arginine translocation signal domain-containing protein, partial [Planctomycetota bacterium]|nr:twin-arginine translocation signal domain-containing protein [Planctomycetota bacterium]